MVNYTRIQGPFGSERLPVPSNPEISDKTDVVQDGPRVPLNDEVLSQQPGFMEARYSRDSRANRADPGAVETLKAAVASWDSTRFVKRLGRPRFEEEAGDFNVHAALQEVPMVLSPEELEYMLDVGEGPKSFQYALDQVQNLRKYRETVGDSPLLGSLAMFVDPIWLAIPPALRLGKASAVAGRAISGAAGGAIAGTVHYNKEGPVSAEEIALGMVLGSAAGVLFYKNGKLVQKHPDFPQDKAMRAAQSKAEVNPGVTAESVAESQAVSESRKIVPTELSDEYAIPANPEFTGGTAYSVASNPMRKASPSYSYGKKKFDLKFESDLDKAAYIVAGAGKSKAHSEIMQWVTSATGESSESILKRGNAIRDDLKARAKDAGPGVMDVFGTPFRYKPLLNKRSPDQSDLFASIGGGTRPKESQLNLDAKLSPEVSQFLDNVSVAEVTTEALERDAKSRGVGYKVMYNMHKTMSNYSPAGKKIADLLYDDNSNLAKNSLESHREAILGDLRTHQYSVEDSIRGAMASEGYGTMKMLNPFTSREAYAAQRRIEKDLQLELFRREQADRLGLNLNDTAVSKKISEMADKVDELHRASLKEMKAAGVEGSEHLLERPGYLNRRWSSASMEDIITRMEAKGFTREETLAKITDLVSMSLRRANPRLDDKISKQVGNAVVDRAMRKGVFEDAAFNSNGSAGVMAEMRDVLKGSGLSTEDTERIMDVLRSSSDEAGKQSFLKHRLDLDYKAAMRIGDETISVTDLIDSRVVSILDQYTKQVSTSAAFARMGFNKPSSIQNLRKELASSVPLNKRKEAVDLFDNTIAHFKGDPSGAQVNANFRLYQAYGRAIALTWGGLWQFTEYANAAAEYGLMKTLKYAVQEIPGFKSVLKPTLEEANSLNHVLAEHSVQSLRLRPFLAKYEDGYDMNMGSAMQLSAQPMNALVPYANAMRYVHHHQAGLVGNLILDRVDRAAKGNLKAMQELEKYGLSKEVMESLSAEINKHGFKVDSWDDAVWSATRPAFAKMMDTAVLKSRLGDVPAFAAFDQLGKLLFTYRTFILTAHNKILAGGLERNGAAYLGLIMMYQFPLALAAVNAQSIIKGNGPLSYEDMTKQALGQLGAIGLFSEPLKWITGESNSIGATYLIPADRGVKLLQSGLRGDSDAAASSAMSLLPVLTTSPFFRGMADQLKD